MASYWLWCVVIRVFKQGFNNIKELAKNEVEKGAKKENKNQSSNGSSILGQMSFAEVREDFAVMEEKNVGKK